MLQLSIRIYSFNKSDHSCIFPFEDPQRGCKRTKDISAFRVLKISMVWIFSLKMIHILLCSDRFMNPLNGHNSKWIDPGL